jgi:single-strand DNA-binding protein
VRCPQNCVHRSGPSVGRGKVEGTEATRAATVPQEDVVNDTMLTVIGNVVDTPHRRVLDNGASVTTFRVASTSRRFDRERNAYVDRDSLFVRVNCWRQLGDNVVRSLIKGDPVIVTGRYFSRRYDVEEQKRTAYELEAYAIGHDLSRGTTIFTRPRSASEALVSYEVDEPVPEVVEEADAEEEVVAPVG